MAGLRGWCKKVRLCKPVATTASQVASGEPGVGRDREPVILRRCAITLWIGGGVLKRPLPRLKPLILRSGLLVRNQQVGPGLCHPQCSLDRDALADSPPLSCQVSHQFADDAAVAVMQEDGDALSLAAACMQRR